MIPSAAQPSMPLPSALPAGPIPTGIALPHATTAPAEGVAGLTADRSPAPPERGAGFDDMFEDDAGKEPAEADLIAADEALASSSAHPTTEPARQETEGATLTRWIAVEYRTSPVDPGDSMPGTKSGAVTESGPGSTTQSDAKVATLSVVTSGEVASTGSPTDESAPEGGPERGARLIDEPKETTAPSTTGLTKTNREAATAVATVQASSSAEAPVAPNKAHRAPDAGDRQFNGINAPEPQPPRAATVDTATAPMTGAASEQEPTIGAAQPATAGDADAGDRQTGRKGPRERSSAGRAETTEPNGQATTRASTQAADGADWSARGPAPAGGGVPAGLDGSGPATGMNVLNSVDGEIGSDPGTGRAPDRPAQAGAPTVLRLPEGGGLPTTAVRQVAEMTIAARPDGVELRLEPDELGAVRLSLATEGETVRVTVLAERPETLDLFRRNAGELAAEFRALGYGGASFTFGREGRGTDGRPGTGPAAPPDQGEAQPVPSGFGTVAPHLAGRPRGPSVLDIRL